MFRWLKRRSEIASANAARAGFERYLDFLRGADGDELAQIIVATTVARQHLRLGAAEGNDSFWPILAALDAGYLSPETSAAPRTADRLREHAQVEGRGSLAAGMTVIVRVLGCYSDPEMRHLGKEMWTELSRGLPHVPDALSASGHEDDAEFGAMCEWMPPGLASTGAAPSRTRSRATGPRSARERQEALAREMVETGRALGAKSAREAMAMSLGRQPTKEEWREHGGIWERNWLRAYLTSLKRRGRV